MPVPQGLRQSYEPMPPSHFTGGEGATMPAASRSATRCRSTTVAPQRRRQPRPVAAAIAGAPENNACSLIGNKLHAAMRVIARNVLVDFWEQHPETKTALERWYRLVKAAQWTSTGDVQRSAPKAKVLNRERVRFEIAGGNYRLVSAFDFRRQIVFVKFIGTHAQYDSIDALTVSQF
jgi:mRNA interferase HigB